MISEGSSDGVIVESDGSVRGADLIISKGSPRENQDFVSWQVETGLGFLKLNQFRSNWNC